MAASGIEAGGGRTARSVGRANLKGVGKSKLARPTPRRSPPARPAPHRRSNNIRLSRGMPERALIGAPDHPWPPWTSPSGLGNLHGPAPRHIALDIGPAPVTSAPSPALDAAAVSAISATYAVAPSVPATGVDVFIRLCLNSLKNQVYPQQQRTDECRPKSQHPVKEAIVRQVDKSVYVSQGNKQPGQHEP